jgi:hypothetical protein
MALRVIRENAGSRAPGYKLDTGVQVVGGIAVVLSDNETVKLNTAAATDAVLGLVMESNIAFPAQSTTPDQQAGQGFDYLDYNRGGLVTVIHDAEVEVWDDGRSTTVIPFLVAGTYAVNNPIYAETVTGKLTDVDGGGTNQRIGRITAVTGTGAASVIRILMEI